MALKLSFPFPIFAPLYAPSGKSSSTEIRLSRWNNADAEKFNHGVKEDEGEIRSRWRSDAAATISGEDAASSRGETFRSRSGPSRWKSNHLKNPNNQKPNSISHPAFRRKRAAKRDDEPGDTMVSRKASVSVSESGVSYVVEGAPFEFKYSYTETPKVKPLKLREAQFPPFGPTTIPRPWTGQKPLPPSKKKPREFDSFKLPPPGMKGVKPVQAPGPFLHGSGPKYTRSREEIMGDPLTKEEIKQLVSSSVKSRRQLNMGRDGLTHNMLENVHALWKRRRICKIKCIGVCTVDMDNVCHQLEEKTGGKIIHRSGGVLYLFRGRNYNYKTRPRYPLMLWKPAAPVYPRLLKQVPEGLTLEEAAEMRKKGRKLIPICKLAKNGAYYDLVKNVREAFEECELIRINCQGLETSDFKKIGAKLQDLVPCVLMSFEEQHILLWRGQNWKSSLPEPEVSLKEASTSSFDGMSSISPPLEVEELFSLHIDANPKGSNASMSFMNLRDVSIEEVEDSISTEIANTFESENVPDDTLCNKEQPKALTNGCVNMDSGGGDGEAVSNTVVSGDVPATALADADTISKRVGSSSYVLESSIEGPMNHDKVQDISEAAQDLNQSGKSSAACTNGVLILWKQAVDGGSAIVLDDANLNADLVYEKAVAFSQVAPPGPVFKHLGLKKVKVQEGEKEEAGDSEVKQVREVSPKRQPDKTHKKSSKFQRKRDFDDQLLDVATQGSLRVDELAKLLA